MSEELKYPHEWFELLKNEIPQPFRFEIEDNLDKEFCGNIRCEKNQFIPNSFDWYLSNQSDTYWENISLAVFNGDSLQKLADKVNEERWNALKVGDTLYLINGKGIIKEIKVSIKEDSHLILESFVTPWMKEEWFNYWTPIKPKHWKEEPLTNMNQVMDGERKTGFEDEPSIEEDIENVNRVLFEFKTNRKKVLNEENAIELLKSKGYKILKPKTEYEEI